MSDSGEKTPHPPPTSEPRPDVSEPILLGKKSPGVARIDAIAAHITFWDRVAIFFGVFIIAYAYGLDGTIRYTYQPLATDSFQTHSTLATLNTVRAVIGAAAQPTAAKIADVFGRVELILVSVFFYVIGTVIEAASGNVDTFIAGAVLYEIGYTCVVLLVEVVIADTTSLRSRVFFSYIPALPFIINTWISGNVTQAVLGVTTWRWGVGMWCIIYTVCAFPLIISLWLVSRKARRAGSLQTYQTPYQKYGGKRLVLALFWQLDVIGIILLILVFGLILVPFTAAKGNGDMWGTGKIIAPLVIGILLIPFWIYWERKAAHPMIPFHLLKDRAVWGALGIALFLNFPWAVQGDFLYTVLVVGFNESTKSATRITSLYSFASVITGALLGIVIFRVRRLKPFIVFGTCLFTVAFGLLIRYRGGESSHGGIVGAQVLLGIAGGFFPYPAQASIQAATKHEHVAVVTGLFLATYRIGSALGNSVSGAVWSQVLPADLNNRLGNSTAAHLWFQGPLSQAALFDPKTEQRKAVIESYKHVQRLLCITAICLCVPLMFFAFCIRNPTLGREQSLPDAEKNIEGQSSEEEGSVVPGEEVGENTRRGFWKR